MPVDLIQGRTGARLLDKSLSPHEGVHILRAGRFGIMLRVSQGRPRSAGDLQVNLLAEQELTAILQMLYALCQKAGTCARVNDTRVQTLLEETDIIQLAMALDKELGSEP